MNSRFAHHMPRAAVGAFAIAAAIATAGTAAAAPVTLDPAPNAAPVATNSSPTGSADSASGGSGSSNVGGTGSSASELINAALCTLKGGKWVPILDICL